MGLFPTSVRATGYGLSYNLAQLLFAAFAPIINNHLWSAVSGDTPSGAHALLKDTAPVIWTYLSLVCSAGALVAAYCALGAGKLERLSCLREERLDCDCGRGRGTGSGDG